MTRVFLLLSLLVGSNALAGPLLVSTDSVANVVSGTYEGGAVGGSGTLNFGGSAQVFRGDQDGPYRGNLIIETSQFNMFGGYIRAADCENGSTINISGGYFQGIAIVSCKAINIFGGDVASLYYGAPSDGIFIFGYDFEVIEFEGEEHIDFRGNEIRLPEDGGVLLTGFFSDGGAINLLYGFDDVTQRSAWEATTLVDVGNPNDVPEPGSLALLTLGLGGIGFARRRKLS